MTVNPYQPGHFVWCAFPLREQPLLPGSRHVAYVVATGEDERGHGAMVAYTTSQAWTGKPPPGVYPFSRADAAAFGQRRAFVLDLRRIAFIPVEVTWFPDLDQPGHGVLGRLPNSIRDRIDMTLIELHRRRPEVVERLGPFWRRPTRR